MSPPLSTFTRGVPKPAFPGDITQSNTGDGDGTIMYKNGSEPHDCTAEGSDETPAEDLENGEQIKELDTVQNKGVATNSPIKEVSTKESPAVLARFESSTRRLRPRRSSIKSTPSPSSTNSSISSPSVDHSKSPINLKESTAPNDPIRTETAKTDKGTGTNAFTTPPKRVDPFDSPKIRDLVAKEELNNREGPITPKEFITSPRLFIPESSIIPNTTEHLNDELARGFVRLSEEIPRGYRSKYDE